VHVKFPVADVLLLAVVLAVVEGVPAAAVTVMDPVEETKELAADPVVEAAADEEAADEAPVETAPPAPPAAVADEAAA